MIEGTTEEIYETMELSDEDMELILNSDPIDWDEKFKKQKSSKGDKDGE